jgi:NAD(P)-dependent dehydrogenase (short-subunit alcohol dehydrogenase family)
MSTRVMLITGGFGGLGTSLGSMAADAGYKVALVGRSKASDTSFPALRLEGVDTGNPGEAQKAVDQVVEQLGGLDVLVNATGDFTIGSVQDGNVEDWARLYAANVVPAVATTKAAIPALIASESGRIINVGAALGGQGAPFVGAASASKAALARLTETTAAELAGSGVTANIVLPTIMDSPRNRQAMPEADPADWLSYDQVSSVILSVASTEAQDQTGQAIPIGF